MSIARRIAGGCFAATLLAALSPANADAQVRYTFSWFGDENYEPNVWTGSWSTVQPDFVAMYGLTSPYISTFESCDLYRFDVKFQCLSGYAYKSSDFSVVWLDVKNEIDQFYVLTFRANTDLKTFGTFDGGRLVVSSVPEPMSSVLLVAGLVGVMAARRRRRRRN